MVIKIEINGLIDAAKIIADAIHGLSYCISKGITFREYKKADLQGGLCGESPHNVKRVRGPRSGYVRPAYLAKKIAKFTGGDCDEIRRSLWARFGEKLVEYDHNRKGFSKEIASSIFNIMTSKK